MGWCVCVGGGGGWGIRQLFPKIGEKLNTIIKIDGKIASILTFAPRKIYFVEFGSQDLINVQRGGGGSNKSA